MKVAVVVPLYNAEKYLPYLLKALRVQTLPHQLILIDSESSDQTRELLHKQSILFQSVPTSSFNHGATRNLAIATIEADWVIFMTQDALPASERTLETLLATRQAREDIALIYGKQLPYPDTGIFGRLARKFHYGDNSQIKDKTLIPQLGIRTCSCSNSFAAYRLADFKEAGGFPEDTILGEDVTMAAKLILNNKAIAYCAESAVYHAHDYTMLEEFRRYFDIGVFHQQQHQILAPFSRAEKEGFKYLFKELSWLAAENEYLRIPEQLVRAFMKFTGYKLGRSFKQLPNWLIKKLSMHKSFWG